jgi:hypothetical protein
MQSKTMRGDRMQVSVHLEHGPLAIEAEPTGSAGYRAERGDQRQKEGLQIRLPQRGRTAFGAHRGARTAEA